MAGLLLALGERPGWAAREVERLLPRMLHSPGLRAWRFADPCFALALVLPQGVAPTLWQTTRAGLAVVVFGEYYPDDRRIADPAAVAEGLAAACRREDWAALPSGNGLYDLVAWDPERRRLALANDATGALLLFGRGGRRERTWCSEPGVLRDAGRKDSGREEDGAGGLDPAGLRSLLGIGYQADHRTLHAGVTALPAAACDVLELGSGGIGTRRVSRLPEPAEGRRPFEQEFPELFLEAVRLRLAGEAGARLPLSGGEDSRLLLGAARRLGCPLQAVTLDGAQRGDAPAAARLAAATGLPHRTLPLSGRPIAEHAALLGAALGTTSDWHGAVFLPVLEAGAAEPGGPQALLLGYLGGTFAGAFVHPSSEAAGRAALRSHARAPFVLSGMPAGDGGEDGWAWAQLPPGAADLSTPPELLVNLFGRQRRYVSYLVRLAWNFGRPLCPFADRRLLQLALGSSRRELAGQHARRAALCRLFPDLAALPGGNDGLPAPARGRRLLRNLARRTGAGKLIRRLAPGLRIGFDYRLFESAAEAALALCTPERRRALPAGLPPLARLALAPVLLQEDEATAQAAVSLLTRPSLPARLSR